MNRRFLKSFGIFGAAATLLFCSAASPALSQDAGAKSRFLGYPPAIRSQAERVAAVAKPGKGADLSREVRLLRIRMHESGILSINPMPDVIFERAVREGWRRNAAPVIRVLREVSPFSVPMWAWLIKDDLLSGNLQELLGDLEGLEGATRRFGPALLGYASWFISYLFAAGCWFVVWGSVVLFLRARPS
ncbi:MAG TPA: hypothetical protein VIV15_14390, partial [Anaerolineales bacterium]